MVLYEFYLIPPWFTFSMVVTRRFESGSGSGAEASGQDGLGLTEDQVREILREEVVSVVREKILEFFLCLSRPW